MLYVSIEPARCSKDTSILLRLHLCVSDSAPHVNSEEWKTTSTLVERIVRAIYDLTVGIFISLFEIITFTWWLFVLSILFFPQLVVASLHFSVFLSGFPLAALRMGYIERRSQSCSNWPEYTDAKQLAHNWSSQAHSEGLLYLLVLHSTTVLLMSAGAYVLLTDFSFLTSVSFLLLSLLTSRIHDYWETLQTRLRTLS